jgi:hypothetical protein
MQRLNKTPIITKPAGDCLIDNKQIAPLQLEEATPPH